MAFGYNKSKKKIYGEWLYELFPKWFSTLFVLNVRGNVVLFWVATIPFKRRGENKFTIFMQKKTLQGNETFLFLSGK